MGDGRCNATFSARKLLTLLNLYTLEHRVNSIVIDHNTEDAGKWDIEGILRAVVFLRVASSGLFISKVFR